MLIKWLLSLFLRVLRKRYANIQRKITNRMLSALWILCKQPSTRRIKCSQKQAQAPLVSEKKYEFHRYDNLNIFRQIASLFYQGLTH